MNVKIVTEIQQTYAYLRSDRAWYIAKRAGYLFVCIVIATDPKKGSSFVNNRYLYDERCALDVYARYNTLVVVYIERWQKTTLGVQIGSNICVDVLHSDEFY